jgi:asparagine synthetase B (glutamine-hydrolysing)
MRGRFAQWFVMREAGRHVKVVMDGQGGDELLGGYVQDTVFYLSDRIRRGAWRPREWTRLRREIAELALVEGSLRWFLLMAPRRYLRDPPRAWIATIRWTTGLLSSVSRCRSARRSRTDGPRACCGRLYVE